MSRSLFAVLAIGLTLALSGCETPEPEDSDAQKAKAPLAELHAPTSADDKQWQAYLQEVIRRNQAGVTDRTMAYYLPADSDQPTPEDPEGRSKYDRQLENVQTVVLRTVLPNTSMLPGSTTRSRARRCCSSAAPPTARACRPRSSPLAASTSSSRQSKPVKVRTAAPPWSRAAGRRSTPWHC